MIYLVIGFQLTAHSLQTRMLWCGLIDDTQIARVVGDIFEWQVFSVFRHLHGYMAFILFLYHELLLSDFAGSTQTVLLLQLIQSHPPDHLKMDYVAVLYSTHPCFCYTVGTHSRHADLQICTRCEKLYL